MSFLSATKCSFLHEPAIVWQSISLLGFPAITFLFRHSLLMSFCSLELQIYLVVHFQRNSNPMGKMVLQPERAVMTTHTHLLQSQLTVLAFPTLLCCTKKILQEDSQKISPHLEGPPLVVAGTLLDLALLLLVLQLEGVLRNEGSALSPEEMVVKPLKPDLITHIRKSL